MTRTTRARRPSQGAANGEVESTWPRGLYVIVVSVILARRWYVIARPFDSGRNTTRYRENNTRKETRVAAVTRGSRHERDHRRSLVEKAVADVVFEPNVSFWLCTSRGTSGLELKATVSRWQPMLSSSHRLLPPRPDNTDSYTRFPRS